MKAKLTLLLALLAAACRAAPSLSMSPDRERIYLGDSIVLRVTLKDGGQNPPAPEFTGGSAATVEYLGPQTSLSRQITIVNGKRQSVENSSTVFTYVVTPERAGAFQTGSASVSIAGRTLSCPSATVSVVAPQDLDFAKASLSCRDKSVIVDGRFTIQAEILLRAIPGTDGVEPIFPQRPPAISARFLDFGETEGLRQPSADDVLGPLVSRDSSQPFFQINSYQSSAFPSFGSAFGGFPSFGSAFGETPIRFRPNPERIEIDGEAWWRYSISAEYSADAEGEYTFGPLTLKGAVATGVQKDDYGRASAVLSDIYVLAPAISVRVVPPPEEGRPAWFSGSVGRSMSAKAALDTLKCKVGDPLTLTLDITGDFNPATTRPPAIGAQNAASDAFRFYDDHVESESIQGGKRFRYRLRPLRAGTLEVPAIRTAYYDSTTGEYVTVSTDPIPLQVDATTQIAISGADDPEGETVFPGGIIYAAEDNAPQVAAPSPRGILLPPALFFAVFALARLVRTLRARAAASRHKTAARRARRRFASAARRAARQPGGTGPAMAAARAFAAALCETDSPSLTAHEARECLVAHGFEQASAQTFSDALASLEAIAFGATGDAAGALSHLGGAIDALAAEARRHGARASSATSPSPFPAVALALAATAVLAAVAAFAPGGGIARTGDAPDAFDWESAQSAMSSARSTDEFMAAAREYAAIADGGAATGALFHNLGAALLLADEPGAAAIAYDCAMLRRGATPEVREGRIAAERKFNGSATLPPSRYILAWHYFPPPHRRIAAALAAWGILWLALAAAALAPRLRAKAALAAALAAVAAIALAASVAVSMQKFSPEHPFPMPAAQQTETEVGQ